MSNCLIGLSGGESHDFGTHPAGLVRCGDTLRLHLLLHPLEPRCRRVFVGAFCFGWYFGAQRRFHHGDGDYQLFSDNFMEQVTNVSDIQEEDKEDTSADNWSLEG